MLPYTDAIVAATVAGDLDGVVGNASRLYRYH